MRIGKAEGLRRDDDIPKGAAASKSSTFKPTIEFLITFKT